MSSLTESTIQSALEFAYEKATTGFIGIESATELAEFYVNQHPDNKRKQANALIKWQVAKGATSGFLTGLGGLITLPVAIPVNLASVLFIQLRMIAAIAVIGGYDLKDDKVKSFAYSCLAGNGVKDVLKEVGITAGKQFVLKKVIGQISGGTITRINRVVGFRLLTKFGSKGLVNLGKMVPLVGGLIGGSMDAIWVIGVGNTAKSIFIDDSERL
jgi:uncharacterized protein (DUF697 family)